ncbi:hypothetical protein [Sutcliffiella cohnii]|uniref:hypothetical protein n=1 Tax=Sutcliffiella cohnii TaxID=33932 RepID=UPI00082C4DDE|nr:hypothetical protein [Sutcliffiella cohnii]
MFRKVNWETHDGEIKGENIVLGKVVIFKGLWSGFLFHVLGLGLTKAEKSLRIPRNNEKLTFYCLRWGVTVHGKKSSYLDDLRNVVITYDEPLFKK